MKENADKKKLLKIVKILFGILSVVFLIWYFIANREAFSSIGGIGAGAFLLAMLFYVVYKVTLASLWHYLTRLNGCAIGYGKAITAYFYSLLGKYIPGKVFLLGARLACYKEEDAPLSKVTVCFFVENVCTLLGAAMLFILSLFFFPNSLLEEYRWLVLLLIALFFLCINPKVINAVLKIAGKLFKRELAIPMTYTQTLKAVLLFIGNWLIAGAGFYILVRAVYPQAELSQLLYCGGVWGIAAIAGILAVFAPSGLGVREGMVVAGLSLIMPTEYAVLVSVASRLWVTIPELVLAAGAFIVNRLHRNKDGA